MFSKLPEIFDRDFATGYFLPMLLFFSFSYSLLKSSFSLPTYLNFTVVDQVDFLLVTTILIVCSWLGGFLLSAVNRDVIRFLEGYGNFNPLRVLIKLERSRYKRAKNEISRLDEMYFVYEEKKRPFPVELSSKRSILLRKFVERYPDEERFLLPTSFGNIIRAFEVYPRIMYGVDSIPVWDRLLAIIPVEYLKFVNSSKAQMDFWINIWLLDFVFFVEYLIVIIYSGGPVKYSIFLISGFVFFFAYFRLKAAAVEWGKFVKSAFDIYLPELYKKLGFNENEFSKKESIAWKRFSQAVIYADPEVMPTRNFSNAESMNDDQE